MSNVPLTIAPKSGFSKLELYKIDQYVITKGTQPLPPQVAEKLFESYLNGSSLAEISKTYQEYESGAIHYTAYHYDWPLNRDELTIDVQERIKQKILHSKYQQLELVDTMIKVAHAEAMNSFRAYLKHPCDRNIPKTFRIKTIKELAEAIDMMGKIVGQDNVKKVEMIKSDKEDESEHKNKKQKPEADLSEKTAKDLLTALNKVKI